MAGRLTGGLGNAEECPLMCLEWPLWDRARDTTAHGSTISQGLPQIQFVLSSLAEKIA